MQTAIVIIIVAAAAFFMIRRFYSSANRKNSPACGCGCNGCSPNPKKSCVELENPVGGADDDIGNMKHN